MPNWPQKFLDSKVGEKTWYHLITVVMIKMPQIFTFLLCR
uniref:Uncharacterized protein n=1 Tax=Anguilla anguilla TaxID=7936 RepID=A0A0E9U3Z0_ANGAN